MALKTNNKLSRRSFLKAIGAQGIAIIGGTSLAGFARVQKSPVKIGLVTWTEGPAAEIGLRYAKGFYAGIKYINEQGGILGGRKVEGVEAPQGQAAEQARSSAMRLLMKYNLKMLVGPHWAIAQKASLPVVKRYNILYTSRQGGNWLYKQKYPGTFILVGPAYGRSIAQIKWAEEKGIKRALMLESDIPFNHDVADAIKEKWGKPDSPVEIADFIWYTFGETDLKSQVTKALAQEPDLIWSEAWSTDTTTALLKELSKQGYTGKVCTDASYFEENIAQLPKEVTEGVYLNKEWVPDPNIPENKQFTDFWEKEFGELPDNDNEVIWAEVVFGLKTMDYAGVTPDGTEETLMKLHDALRSFHWVSPMGVPVKLSPGGLGLFSQLAFGVVKDQRIVLDEYVPMKETEWLPWL